MTFEYINKQVFGSITYYDLVISDSNFTDRITGVKVAEDDREAFANAAYAQMVAKRLSQANLAYLLNVFSGVKEKAVSRIESGAVTTEGLIALNEIINTSLGFVGVHIESPDIKNTLKGRVELTVSKIKEKFENSEVTDSVKAQTMAAVSLLSSALG